MVERKWTRCDTFSHPKSKIPKKPASMAKAKIPSEARMLPNTFPTNREYLAQLVPKEKTRGMPLATPRANVRANTRIQNLVSCSHAGSLVFKNIHLKKI